MPTVSWSAGQSVAVMAVKTEPAQIVSVDEALMTVAVKTATGGRFQFHWTAIWRAYTGQLPKVGLRGCIHFGEFGPFAFSIDDA